jgi:flagellum-specific peptidoglycan hydrolase FlgJ
MPSNQDCKKFVNEIAPIIQKVAKEKGYPICSTVIAQACIESAYGTSSLGYKYHNYFGMKCGSAWKGASVNMRTKEEYTVGTLTTIRDNFRAYPDMESGIRGYYDFIGTKRYANLKTATTPQMYAERLKADGYATSSTYVNTLMNTVRKWNLDKYDNNNPVVDTIHDTKPVLKQGAKGDWVVVAQGRLVVAGYPIAVDGIFGPRTTDAVKKFQLSKGLTPDGIIGPKTWAHL